MNPVFILLILMFAVSLWFVLSFAFIPLGQLVYKIIKNAIDKMDKDDEKQRRESDEKR